VVDRREKPTKLQKLLPYKLTGFFNADHTQFKITAARAIGPSELE